MDSFVRAVMISPTDWMDETTDVYFLASLGAEVPVQDVSRIGFF